MRIKSTVRYELKYLITWQQRDALMADLTPYMAPDNYGDRAGSYTITSLYYDSPTYSAYWEKIEGEKLRRKVRLRCYGAEGVLTDTDCFLEIKERQDKTLAKRRIRLPYQELSSLSNMEAVAQSFAEVGDIASKSVADEVAYLHHVRRLEPACIVRYNRQAFNGGGEYPDLRVTFDTELRGRAHDLTLLSTGYADDRYFLPPDACVLEIKANQSVPYWLAQLIHTHGCTMRRISKYCLTLEHCGALLMV